ncbi:MAG: putative membrane protein YfcA [Flavobacteriales bacterium]|jgi:uncharacterized membrane protein YfcA
MAGGGAGLLQLPALIFLGLPFSVALTTHKIATVALGLGATIKHSKQGHIRWRLSIFMLVCGLPGVALGANTILSIPANFAQAALGILTIGLGIYSYYKRTLGQTYALKNQDIKGFVFGGLGLFFLGFFNGSLTSGTGLFVTVWLVSWFGLDFKRATAYTMIMVGLFWNATGAATLAIQSPAQWDWLPMLLLGSALGGYLGAHIAVKYGNPLIKRVFEFIAIAVGLALIYKTINL